MKLSTGSLLALALVPAISAQAAGKGKDKTPTRPNVIFIYADDLGFGDLECYGAKNVETPNVNRLAANGIRFTNGYATAATSTPSRYSMLTGEYAWRKPGTDVAAGNAGMIIRPEQFTIADVFKSAGYATADRVPCVFIENGSVANYDPSAPIEVSYQRNFPGEPTGRANSELLYNLKPSHGHDMSIVNGISRIGYMKGGGKALWKDENIADSITAHAVNFINQHKKEPFFMYFATNDVHVPRFPHERFRGKNKMGLRGDAIVQFDWTVGQIMAALEKAGLSKNTLIILSSDNGPVVDDGYADRAEELLNGHSPTGNLRGGKYSAFEGGTRIPLIVHWPAQIKGAQESNTLVSQIDWLASMAELVGARIPKGAAPDSYNYLDNLLGRTNEDRPWIIEQASNHTLSVRTRNWKYIEGSDGGKMITWGPKIETGYAPVPQLYNMSDETEQVDVAAKNPQKVFELERILRKVRTQTLRIRRPSVQK